MKSWKELFQTAELPDAGLVYHECSVGAALPIISPLKDLIATGDKVDKIEGIFQVLYLIFSMNFQLLKNQMLNFQMLLKS